MGNWARREGKGKEAGSNERRLKGECGVRGAVSNVLAGVGHYAGAREDARLEDCAALASCSQVRTLRE